jgi:integrase
MAAIYRRGRQWWGRVQRQGRDLREPLKTTSEIVARERLGTWLAELDRVGAGGKPHRTYDDAMVKFIHEHLPTLKPTSARRYRVSMEHLTDAFEGLALAELTSARFSDFETKRRLQGAKPPTIRRDLACLSSMFGCCIDWEWLEHNPVPPFMRRRRKRGLREAPPHTRYRTQDEEDRLLAQTSGTLRDAIILAIDTGLRREELFTLRWTQVDLARNQIDLGTDTKSGKPRQVPLLARSAQLVGTMARHIKNNFVVHRRRDGARYVQMNKGLKGAAIRAKIPPLTWHDLRRTCGCRLLQDYRMPMERVSRWLGHSSVMVTEKHYAFLDVTHLHDAIRPGTNVGTGTADAPIKAKDGQ